MSFLFLILFSVILLAACKMDLESFMVYQFLWWIAAIPVAGLMWGAAASGVGTTEQFLGLAVYILLQEMWFCRFYGRADCHAFSFCALAQSAFGGGFTHCVMHMATAFLLLFVIQAFRHNINRCGNLKHPVAFIPYITISFWIVLVPLSSF